MKKIIKLLFVATIFFVYTQIISAEVVTYTCYKNATLAGGTCKCYDEDGEEFTQTYRNPKNESECRSACTSYQYDFASWSGTASGYTCGTGGGVLVESNGSYYCYLYGQSSCDTSNGWMQNSMLVKYTLTYNNNGGSGCSYKTVSATSNDEINNITWGSLCSPTRSGYTFNGWYTAASGGSVVNSNTKVGGSDATVYAHWTEKAKACYLCGTSQNGQYVWTNSPSSDQCIAKSQYGTEAACLANNNTAATYTLTYNLNGGSGTCPSQTATEGNWWGTLCSSATRANYTFDGWYTAASGGTKITSSTTATGNLTVYAHWTYNGTPSTPDVICPAGQYYSGGSCVDCNVGKYCLGGTNSAAVQKDCPTGYTSNKKAKSETECYIKCSANTYLKTAKDKTCTACETGKTSTEHNVNYNSTSTCTAGAVVSVTGITVTPNPSTIEVGKTVQLTATITPENASNKNVTWVSSDPTIATVDENGLVTGVKVGTVTITVTTEDGSKSATAIVNVVEAVVVPTTYKINYNANGGTGTMESTIATVGVEGTLRANTFKYSGHTFAGWKAYVKDSNGTFVALKNSEGKDITLKDKAKFTDLFGNDYAEVTLFAQWNVVNPKTGIFAPTLIIGGLLLVSALGYYIVKKKNIVLN